jgi:spore cortex formation protein SpoVR/YcgB (stage V sporulation)
VKYFLLSFDRQRGTVVGSIEEFGDADTAVRARFRRETELSTNPNIEVVVLGAEDERSLESTHSRYFGGPDLDRLTPVG